MDDFSNISNLQEEPDIKIEDTTTDSLVFSVTYENYEIIF